MFFLIDESLFFFILYLSFSYYILLNTQAALDCNMSRSKNGRNLQSFHQFQGAFHGEKAEFRAEINEKLGKTHYFKNKIFGTPDKVWSQAISP